MIIVALQSYLWFLLVARTFIYMTSALDSDRHNAHQDDVLEQKLPASFDCVFHDQNGHCRYCLANNVAVNLFNYFSNASLLIPEGCILEGVFNPYTADVFAFTLPRCCLKEIILVTRRPSKIILQVFSLLKLWSSKKSRRIRSNTVCYKCILHYHNSTMNLKLGQHLLPLTTSVVTIEIGILGIEILYIEI